MNMTMEQEAQFLKEHEKDIQRLVRRYQQKAGRRYPDNTEDLRQEARQALLLLLRAADTLEEAENCYYAIIHALGEYVRAMAVVSIPQRRFQVEIKKVFILSLDVPAAQHEAVQMEDQVIGDVDRERFFHALSGQDCEILVMRLDGCSQKEISQAVGLSESQVSRRILQIGRRYQRCSEACPCAG